MAYNSNQTDPGDGVCRNGHSTQRPDLRGPVRDLSVIGLAATALALSLPSSVAWGQGEFDELSAIIEINATDGDVGFHAKLDGGPWSWVTIRDPDGRLIFFERAKGRLRQQGLTENFFESDEPQCFFDAQDPEADPDDVVTLEEFLERFKAGLYRFAGRATERGFLVGETEFSHNIPAAPDISGFDGAEDLDPNDTVISWAEGDDLGECDIPASIPDPASVAVVRWEVVVEPDVDMLPAGMLENVFSVQLPADRMSVRVPAEFLQAYAVAGVTEFKFEIGAREASGNQTFSEGEFALGE